LILAFAFSVLYESADEDESEGDEERSAEEAKQPSQS
jgi:hypothetical protein